MLLLDALYINNSGGLYLLNYLVKILERKEIPVCYLFDVRNTTEYPAVESDRIIRMKPSLRNRKKFYKSLDRKFSKVFCFGNVPPPVALHVDQVYTYLHQFFYLDPFSANKHFFETLKLLLKKHYFLSKIKHTDVLIVQSEHMAVELKRRHGLNVSIEVIPFYEGLNIETCVKSRLGDFVYIANGNPHKNHVQLLDEWLEFRTNNKDSFLHLTVCQEMYPDLHKKIESLKKENIINHGLVPRHQVFHLLARNKYLVHPSLAESFGLALIEAAEFDSIIVAPDLPYVSSVIHPSITYDPHVKGSLAKAMLNVFKGYNSPAKLKTVNQIDRLVYFLSSE